MLSNTLTPNPKFKPPKFRILIALTVAIVLYTMFIHPVIVSLEFIK